MLEAETQKPLFHTAAIVASDLHSAGVHGDGARIANAGEFFCKGETVAAETTDYC